MAATTIGNHSEFLDLASLGGLAHMRFATRRQIEGAYSGRHRSKQRGGAAEFVDYREYSAGEDLRRLDWKVLARTGRPFVRVYQDETNLLCTLLLDASGSMLFGSARGNGGGRNKLEYAQRLATALSHVIGRQQDQVGAATASDGLNDVIEPGSTPGHVHRVQEQIAAAKPLPQSRLADALRDLFTRLHRRGVLMILSDFLVDDLQQVFAAARLFVHRRSEVIVLHLIDPDEERLPAGRAFRFEGMENDGRVDASPDDIRTLYEAGFARHAAAVRDLSLAAGCDYRRISTATPYLETLRGFLVERSG